MNRLNTLKKINMLNVYFLLVFKFLSFMEEWHSRTHNIKNSFA